MPKQIWEQVFERILSDVGEHAPGEMMCTEIQYTELLGVSRTTVRKAVDELVRRNLVVRVAGKGLMVADARQTTFEGNVLISCACLPGDGDNFKTVQGLIEAADARHLQYKTLNYTDPAKRLQEFRETDFSIFDAAVITCYESEEDAQAQQLLLDSGLPALAVGNESSVLPFVDYDSFNAGFLMGELLAQYGHRRILYIGTDRPILPAVKVKGGFIHALEEYGIPVLDELFVEVNDPGVPVYTALSDQRELPGDIGRYLDGSVPFTAVTGHSAFPIFSFLKRLLQQRPDIHIPRDISLVSLGDELYLPWLDIPLSGIDVPRYEIGYSAMEKVYALLSGQITAMESQLLPVRLVQRPSVEPPPR